MKQPTRNQRNTMYDQFAKLYKQGLSDSKIAKEVGCSRLMVFAWRQRNQKPTNNPKTPKVAVNKQAGERIPSNKKVDDDRARELYDSGLDDKEIGEVMGISPSTIAAWRHRHNLSCQRRVRKEVIDPEAKKLGAVNAKARAKGMTYGEYMAAQYAAQHT